MSTVYDRPQTRDHLQAGHRVAHILFAECSDTVQNGAQPAAFYERFRPRLIGRLDGSLDLREVTTVAELLHAVLRILEVFHGLRVATPRLLVHINTAHDAQHIALSLVILVHIKNMGARFALLCVSLVFWTFARGQRIYEPVVEWEKEIEEACMKNLDHPDDSVVHLVEYVYDGMFDAEGASYLTYTNATNDDDYREPCTTDYELNDGDITILHIVHSDTCHDVLFYNDTDNPVVCLYLTIELEAPEILAPVLTIIFSSLSIIASALVLVTHLIFPALRTLPSKLVMNLALAFLVGDVCVIVATALALRRVDSESFDIVSVFQWYFFYARFVWMALAGFEMCRTIHVGTQLRFDSEKKRLKLLIGYMLFGWSIPLLPITIIAVVHFKNLENRPPTEHFSYAGIGGVIITFVPVGIIVLFNIGLVVYLTFVLHKAYMWQTQVSDALTVQKRNTNFTRIFLIVLSVLGLTWIVMVVLYIDDIANHIAVQIIHIVLNFSQPIFVCFAFLGTKKILLKYLTLFGCRETEEEASSSAPPRFRNRRLISFLFTDKELAAKMSKYRFSRSNRMDSGASMSTMVSQDSRIAAKLPSNGSNSPTIDPPMTPITEEPAVGTSESPLHTAVDFKENTL